MKRVGMLVGNFELNPTTRPIWTWPSFFGPLKETMLKHRQYKYFYIFSSATLNETFMAKYYGVLPRTPKLRPKSEIYTPKRDGENPHPFHTLSPLPHPPPPPGLNSDTGTSKGQDFYPSDQHKDTNNYDATIYQSSRSNEKNAFRK